MTPRIECCLWRRFFMAAGATCVLGIAGCHERGVSKAIRDLKELEPKIKQRNRELKDLAIPEKREQSP